MCPLVTNRRVKDKVAIENVLTTRLNFAEYFRLRAVILEITRIFGEINDTGMSLQRFMTTKKRKGGELRRVLMGTKSHVFVQNDPRTIPSAITFWGRDCANFNRQLIEMSYGLWSFGKLDAEFKQFLFNMVQGKLYLNLQLSRFTDTEPYCTFCKLAAIKDLKLNNIPEDDARYLYLIRIQPMESVEHLFWECSISQDVIQKFFRWMVGLNWLRGNEVIQRDVFFLGINAESKKLCKFDLIWKHFVKFFLYKCRTRKKIPTFPSLKYEFEGITTRTSNQKWIADPGLLANLYFQ